MSNETLLRVVEKEVEEHGGVPRKLFMTEDEQAFNKLSVRSAISNLRKTLSLSEIAGFSDNVRHRLLSINPQPGSNYTDFLTTWASASDFNSVVQHILRTYAAKVRSNLFAGKLSGIFEGDPKMFEILSLGCFALYSGHFKIEPIPFANPKNLSELLFPPNITSKNIQFLPVGGKDLDKLRSSVRSVTNEEMEDFAGDITRRGVVTPLNLQYPGIDGIARFEYGNTIYSAFIQVTVAETHKFRPEAAALLRKLRTLAETSAASAQGNHKCVLMWLIEKNTVNKSKSLDKKLTESLGTHIDEYVVYGNLDQKAAVK